MSFRQPKQPRRDPLPPQLAQVHLNAAGIDVGSEFPVVAVPPDRDDQPVQNVIITASATPSSLGRSHPCLPATSSRAPVPSRRI